MTNNVKFRAVLYSSKNIRVDVGFYALSEIPDHSGICEADFTFSG